MRLNSTVKRDGSMLPKRRRKLRNILPAVRSRAVSLTSAKPVRAAFAAEDIDEFSTRHSSEA